MNNTYKSKSNRSTGKNGYRVQGNRGNGPSLPGPEPLTSPLEILSGRKLLVLADAQNIDYSAKDLGYKASWKKLGEIIDSVSKSAVRHVFLAENPGSKRRSEYLMERGWHTHSKLIKTVSTHKGDKTDSNIDNFLVFFAGVLCTRAPRDTDILILSGDGEMVNDLAEIMGKFSIKRRIITMSLPNSTSWRLNAAFNPLIEANIEIGKDCLRERERSDKDKDKDRDR